MREFFADEEPGCVDVTDEDITDDDAVELANMVEEMPEQVSSFLAKNCGLTSTAVTTLADALTNTDVVEVDLSMNPDCGDDGALALANMLQDSPMLETLNLTGCGISNEGATALIEAFKANENLTNLVLEDNDIDDELLAELDDEIEGD